MGLWDKIKNAASAAASAVGINYSRNDVNHYPPKPSRSTYQPKIAKKAADISPKEEDTDSEPMRLMEKTDDSDLARAVVNNVYNLPFLKGAGSVGRAAIKHVSAILTGGSVLRTDGQMKLYEGFERRIVEGSSVPIEARVRQVEYIGNKVLSQAMNGKGIKQNEAVRAVTGVLEVVREARKDYRYSSLLENLEGKLETCEGRLGSVPGTERVPYTKEQLAEMNGAYSTLVSYIWFGKNDGKKLEQAKEALTTYKRLRSNSVAAFNDPVTARFELETLEDLMKLKEKALAANKDIETGLYTKSVEHEDIRKYAVVAQTLRKHATVMDSEIIKLDKLGNKITEEQKNRKRKVKAVRESIDRTMKDVGSTIYRSIENSKIGTSAQTQERDIYSGSQKIEGIQRVVYEKAVPFGVGDLVLSPYDQLGRTQWSELAKKKMTIRAYTELAHGVNAKVQTKAVELTQKEVLRAYDMARTITDGIHATACVEARKTNVDDVLNHLLEKMLYQKLKESAGYRNGVNAFGAYTRAREAERQWRSTPVYNIFEMGKRNEARRTAEAEYKKAENLAPEITAYRRAAERIGENRRAA